MHFAMTLQKTIELLATEFAKNVIAALRSAPVTELAESKSEPTRSTTIAIKVRGGGVRHVDRDVLTVTGLLSRRPGLRAEQIRAQLRWDKKTTTRALTMALGEKRVSKKGQRRGTTYYYVP
jgi:hypothetical protein